jgi:DNA-binding NarL/FixJ family response regulator
MPIQVAIVEDSREIREGLSILIDSSPGFRCVAACESAEEALIQLPKALPDVALMDIQLPGMSGIECIRILKTRMPKLQIMMLTVFEDHDRIFQSLAAGASGYLVKKTPPQRILEAIQDLHAGGSPMSNQIARRVVDAFRQPAPKPQSSAPVAREAQHLSAREWEILQHLAQGFLYKEIADSLKISIETVRTHIRNIYEKLHVHSRTEALLKVFPDNAPTHRPPAAPNRS